MRPRCYFILSCCKHRIMPTAYRFRMYQGNGSTCLRAPYTFVINIGKGTRTVLPALLLYIVLLLLTIWPIYPYRVREGHPRSCTGDIASRARPRRRHLPAVFNPILPEPCAGRAAQRACAAKYVPVLLADFLPMHHKRKSLLIHIMLVG